MIGGLSRPSLNTSTLLTTSCRRLFLLILYFLLLDDLTFLLAPVEALHLQGTFESKDFLLFLAKFGVQKVDSNEVKSTSGYIYGNITSRGENSLAEWDMYLVVLDSDYFVQFYSQRHYNSPDRCSVMFSDVDTIAWDKFCFPRGQEDFLRRIPCPVGRLCTEELANPASVIAGNQFTYRIIDKNQPRFWYASLVGCQRARRKKGCSWKYNTTLNVAIDYDIWFVNGDPASKHLNPFEHQFSYEVHDVIEIYLAFLILNGLLLALQVWVFRNQRHVLIYLLTTILVLEVAGILCNLVNMSVFAVDGKGLPALRILGNFLDMCSQSIMMLELLYIAKGWSISYKHLTTRGTILLYTIWILYSLVYIVLFSFTLKAVDPIRDVDEWQTVPGYCILVFRVVIMFYFLYELQDTFAKESSELKRNFYIRFAAGFLVWFIYLPVVALISPKIAGLWRYKTLLDSSKT
ncbi:integral membrane protein GPR180-like isoform X2 [Watersipora subatra]|uniref:integral membrane protein GPR180-like isoform X2 n=1 Tax=Watersipora subatra TaxID=2589382 RepID=UPI00355BA2CF